MNSQDSMVEQLCALYAERERLQAHFPGKSVADIVETATGVRPTEPQGHRPPAEATDSIEAQLIDLYADKETLAEAFPGMELDDIVHAFATPA